MNRVTLSGNDGFWARVRTLLNRDAPHLALGPTAPTLNPNRQHRAVQRIEDELRRGWTESAQRNVSLCVLALELDVYADYFSAYGRDTVDDTLERLRQTIQGLLPRPTDICLRNGRAGFILFLPDMPLLMARKLTTKLTQTVRHEGLVNKESHAGHVTLSMGLVVANPQGNVERKLLATAQQAVLKAQRRGLSRLEVVDLRPADAKKRKAA